MTPGCKRNAMPQGAPVTRSAGCGPVMILHAARIMAALRGDQRGSIAVEFALVAPVLMVVLAGVIDIGSAAYVRHSLDTRVTAAAEYALMRDKLTFQGDADKLATELLGLLQGGASETVEVAVNNTARVKWSESGSTTSTGPGDADAHYCIGSDGEIAWNLAVDDDKSCTSGEVAGQFVRISATARHVSIFTGYAFSDEGTVGASAVLRLN